MDDGTLLPVGHYHGRFFPGPDRPLRNHRVRVGAGIPRLDADEFRVWTLAHGLPDRPDDGPWTRREVETEARADGLAASTAVLDGLLQRGLVVAVPPGPEGLGGFARAYRLHSLLNGLGNSPDDLGSFSIGVAGFAPVVTVGRTAAGLWQWAPHCGTLHEACALLAHGAREAGETDEEHTDPARLLERHLLPALRRLVAHSAAYLDVAETPPA